MPRTKSIITAYLEGSDWRNNENANTRPSVSDLYARVGHQTIAEYNVEHLPHGDLHKDGSIHSHDLGYPVQTVYCVGHDLFELIEKGISTVGGTKSNPAKHLDTLVDHMVNFLCMAQNECAGAQSFSNVSTLLAPFIRSDNLTYTQIKQNIQRMVFSLNYENRVAFQQSFTNFTLDLKPAEVLKDTPAIVGGIIQDYTYGELTREVELINQAFFEVYLEGDGNGKLFTFPIPTVQITDESIFEDTVVNNLFWDAVVKFGTPYFANFIGTGLDAKATRSMCCVTGDTRLFAKTFRGTSLKTAKKIWQQFSDESPEKRNDSNGFRLFFDGEFHNATVARKKDGGHILFTLANGSTINLTTNHTCLTNDGTKKLLLAANDVEVGDTFPINTQAIENGIIGSYDSGYLIGVYVGDGYNRDNKTLFAFNADTDQESCKKVETILREQFAINTTYEKEKNSCIRLLACDSALPHFINKFVDITQKSITRSLKNTVFRMSLDFRNGLFDGMLAADGSKRDFIQYNTSSPQLADDFVSLCSSIGRHTNKRTSNRTDKTNTEYEITVYSNKKTRRFFKDSFFTDTSGTVWSTIIGKEYIQKEKYYYDFEVDSDSHLFTLGNGIITHNCRLNLSAEEAEQPHGLWALGSKTGSLAVATINLNRIGFLAKRAATLAGKKNDEEYIKKQFMHGLYNKMNSVREQLRYRRNRIEEGRVRHKLLPIFSEYVGTERTFFSTIGICGMNEACVNAFGRPMHECEDFVIDVLDKMKKRIRKYKKDDGILYNFEQTPAESAMYRLAKEDRKLYPEIYVSEGADGTPFLTNSTHEPMSNGRTLQQRLEWAAKTDQYYTGGTILHIWLGEKPNKESVKALVKKVLQYNIPYFTISPEIAFCKECGNIRYGQQKKCTCGGEFEMMQRVVGYYAPMARYNPGQKAQHAEKRFFDEDIEGVE